MIQTMIDMRPATANELTTAERAELGRYEAVIKRGLDTFVEVGNALVAIRDGKLYRADYSTFDEYCRGRWQISRSYAHRMIDAAQVVENLLPIGNILPANEAQARPLTKLEPAQQRVVWQEAVSEAGGKPTAAQVERAVERVRPQRPKPTPPPAKVVYVEPTAQRPSDDVLHARQDQLLDAIVDKIAALPQPDPDEAEAIALVAARDAQRPSYERVPEPVAAPATDALERLKRASLLRYMLIQARDAARRDYGDLTGRHTDMLEFESGVADMLPPLESLIAILGGPKAIAILEGTK